MHKDNYQALTLKIYKIHFIFEAGQSFQINIRFIFIFQGGSLRKKPIAINNIVLGVPLTS